MYVCIRRQKSASKRFWHTNDLPATWNALSVGICGVFYVGSRRTAGAQKLYNENRNEKMCKNKLKKWNL